MLEKCLYPKEFLAAVEDLRAKGDLDEPVLEHIRKRFRNAFITFIAIGAFFTVLGAWFIGIPLILLSPWITHLNNRGEYRSTIEPFTYGTKETLRIHGLYMYKIYFFIIILERDGGNVRASVIVGPLFKNRSIFKKGKYLSVYVSQIRKRAAVNIEELKTNFCLSKSRLEEDYLP